MTWFLALLLIIAMGATAYALVRGVIAMASGKEVDQAKQQDYMRKRVFFQGIAIVIIAVLLILARQGA